MLTSSVWQADNRGQAFVFAVFLITVITKVANGQGHTDIEFSYLDGKIVIESQDARGLVFASNFPTSGIEQQFSTMPGYASETDVGMGVGAGDQIVYNVLDNLLYWDGETVTAPAAETRIRIRNNPPGSAQTMITAISGPQPGSVEPPINRIGKAGGTGDFHTDLQWFLEPNNFPASPPPPEIGAYGVLLTLSTTASGVADSDPLMYIFNFGLNPSDFDRALDTLADILNEPTSFVWKDFNAGYWSNADNWTPAGGPPGVDDLAAIQSSASTVIVAGSQSAKNTTVSAGKLMVDVDAMLNSNLNVSGGRLTGNGTIVGDVNLNAGVNSPGGSYVAAFPEAVPEPNQLAALALGLVMVCLGRFK